METAEFQGDLEQFIEFFNDEAAVIKNNEDVFKHLLYMRAEATTFTEKIGRQINLFMAENINMPEVEEEIKRFFNPFTSPSPAKLYIKQKTKQKKKYLMDSFYELMEDFGRIIEGYIIVKNIDNSNYPEKERTKLLLENLNYTLSNIIEAKTTIQYAVDRVLIAMVRDKIKSKNHRDETVSPLTGTGNTFVSNTSKKEVYNV